MFPYSLSAKSVRRIASHTAVYGGPLNRFAQHPIRAHNAVLGQGRRADDTVQAHLTASGGGDAELRTGEGLTGDAVPLLNSNAAPGLIFEGKGYGFALLDLNRLALRVDDKASGGLGLGDYHALSRLQAGNADL